MKKPLLALVLALAVPLPTVQARLALEAIYSSHMVLQREVPLPIHGTAKPHASVTVEFAGQKQIATAGSGGKWTAALDPIKAGGPYVLTAASGGELIKLEDILIGDVWIASGQSNMAWQVRQSTDGPVEVKAIQPPLLRGCLIPYKLAASQPMENVEAKWFRSDQPEQMQFVSGQGYFCLREVVQKVGIPIGIISVAKGGTPAEAFMRRELLASDPDYKPILDRMDEYDRAYAERKRRWDAEAPQRNATHEKLAAEAKAQGKKPPAPKRLLPPDYHSRPCGLWNSMIHPLVKLPIKGVLWNQGVSNSHYSEIYASLFQALIRDWREQWNCGNFPFVCIQIERNNNYKTLREAPPVAGDDMWAEIRQAQAEARKLPNTYMVPAFDQGDDGTNRHPLDKKTPGRRLANMLLQHIYGVEGIVADAPRHRATKAVADGFEVTFDHVADGLKVQGDGKILGFAVGDDRGNWRWTNAEVTGKDTVRIKTPAEMPNAQFVRYNWAQYCMGNLYGSTGLPAEPFRTDSFPYITKGRR